MMAGVLVRHSEIRDLGDGLVLRSARPDDRDQLVEMNGRLHADDVPVDESIREWTHDLFDLDHPSFRLEEMTVVEDTASRRIVSTVCTIPQTWTYEGVPLRVGRPELVATEADHRRRGLVRDQFELLHRRGDQRGELIQFITGIPWYYRQFGYEFAIDLVPTPRLAPRTKPAPVDDRWSLRPATEADVDLLVRIGEHSGSGIQLRAVRDAAMWRVELARRPGNGVRVDVIEEQRPDGTRDPVGYVVVQNRLWDGHLAVRAFELLPGRSWLGATAATLAHVRQLASEPTPAGEGSVPLGVCLVLPDQHPSLRCARSQVVRRTGSAYGLYVRVADLPAFLRAVTPALEARLAASPAPGFTGRYRLDLFTDGVELVLEDGRLTSIAAWRPTDEDDDVEVAMPRNCFIHLLLGNRSMAEMERSVADCEARNDTGALLTEVLFPRMSFDEWIVS